MLKYCKSIYIYIYNPSIYLSVCPSIHPLILRVNDFYFEKNWHWDLGIDSDETHDFRFHFWRNCTNNNARQQPSCGLRSAQTCRTTLGSYIMRPAYYAAIKALWKYLSCTTRSSSALISPKRFSGTSLRNAPASLWSRANPEQRMKSLTASSSPKHLWNSARNIPTMNVTSARIYICASIMFTGTADMAKEGKVGLYLHI